ncbi:magnesium transporter [Halobaculum sp. MBLA0143]|uniref:magnesium transporter n=1 Tax=Halobaculum sp. MBLA0143 TaxID=3079933 RepID=UPI0035240989
MTVRSVAVEGYRNALPTVGASALGGLVAGAILSGMQAELAAVPGLLVVVPAFLAIRGSVYGSLGSRLSTGLHQGLVGPTLDGDGRGRLWRVVVGSLSVGVLSSLFAAGVAALLLPTLGRPAASPAVFAGVALVAALLAGAVLSAVVVAVVFLGFRRGVDPDDLVGPAVTTAGDLFGLASLVVAVRVVGWLADLL